MSASVSAYSCLPFYVALQSENQWMNVHSQELFDGNAHSKLSSCFLFIPCFCFFVLFFSWINNSHKDELPGTSHQGAAQMWSEERFNSHGSESINGTFFSLFHCHFTSDSSLINSNELKPTASQTQAAKTWKTLAGNSVICMGFPVLIIQSSYLITETASKEWHFKL